MSGSNQIEIKAEKRKRQDKRRRAWMELPQNVECVHCGNPVDAAGANLNSPLCLACEREQARAVTPPVVSDGAASG